jgi:hypothetical protein
MGLPLGLPIAHNNPLPATTPGINPAAQEDERSSRIR